MMRPRSRNGLPPQLTQLVDAAPDGDHWLHEIKFDGYRMHARLRWKF
jgi:ATP-dependent DNA ligase